MVGLTAADNTLLLKLNAARQGINILKEVVLCELLFQLLSGGPADERGLMETRSDEGQTRLKREREGGSGRGGTLAQHDRFRVKASLAAGITVGLGHPPGRPNVARVAGPPTPLAPPLSRSPTRSFIKAFSQTVQHLGCRVGGRSSHPTAIEGERTARFELSAQAATDMKG